MCGIAGIYKFDSSKIKFDEIKTFTDTLFHRGPDGSGYKLLNNDSLALGHRRLSILDLSDLGIQPMCFENRYWITYNGEIFNFIEIKQELIQKGFKFITDSDTEVILASYHVWGKEAFNKFNGMWALAIWDNDKKNLILCRDRFGVKPLHYIFKKDKYFAFASETIAFNKLTFFNKAINDEHLLFSLNQPSALESTGETIFNNIKQLKPGYLLEINENFDIKFINWWKIEQHLIKVSNDFNEQKEMFFNLFSDACKLRLRSDVPIASALSGGLDSSSVFSMINYISNNHKDFTRLPKDWKKAVVATFPNTDIDEKKYADDVIRYLNAEAIYTEPNYSNLVEEVINTTKLFDSISGTPIISVTDVYKAMKLNNIKVSMDGHGGDELLFGYKSSILELFNFYLESNNLNQAEEIAATYANMMSENAIDETKNRLFKSIEAHRKKSVFSQLKKYLLNKTKKNQLQERMNSSDWFYSSNNYIINNDSDINTVLPEKILWDDFLIRHIPYNLRDFDRGAMQNGIEIRMPFMDYRIVCFCMSLPISSKVKHGFTKYILRESMKNLLPENIRLRTNKIGLGAPTAHWFNNQLNEFLQDEVCSHSFRNIKLWNSNIIKNEVIKRCEEKSWDNFSANKFWNILNAHIILNK